jgi:sister chromatid cohesion protein DCC1
LTRLEIKANEPNDKENSLAFAVICTGDKTYQIRQQQTSNSIFVVAPKLVVGHDNAQSIGVTSITVCGASLELNLTKDSPWPYLDILLLPCDGNLADMEVDGRSKKQIYSNVPLSRAEIDKEWEARSAFEHSGICYVPTSAYLLKSWKAILEAALAENIDLSDHKQVDSLWKVVSDDDLPPELFLSIMNHCKSSEFSSWLGNLLLEGQSEKSMLRKDFSAALQDLLPKSVSLSDDFEAYEVWLLTFTSLSAADHGYSTLPIFQIQLQFHSRRQLRSFLQKHLLVNEHGMNGSKQRNKLNLTSQTTMFNSL